ncbi:hypothetical protein JW752_04185 [Candidatus Peregrinibacteria bacterium]|nr:hypothetical protein [Candidatus Peregrinibacteria bacterium]
MEIGNHKTTDSPSRRPEKPSRLMVWGRRLMLLATLVGGGMLAESCAHASKGPGIESPDNDPKRALLKKLGVNSDGAQTDDSEVQFGEGATAEEAEENAKAIIKMLVEGPLEYETIFLKLSDHFVACVRGKAILDAKGLTKKLLKQAGVNGLGEQPGGVEVQKGEGATQTEATDNAMALIQMLRNDTDERDCNVQAEPLADGTWIAIITARPSAKNFAQKMLTKYFSEAKDFGDQSDGSRVSWGVGKDKKEAEENAKTMSFLMGKEGDAFSFSTRSEQMPDGRWVVVINGEKQEGVEKEFETPKDPELIDDVLAMVKEINKDSEELEKMSEEMFSDVKDIAKEYPDLAEMEIEEKQLLQAEEKSIKDGLEHLRRANPLKGTELDTPDNLRKLAETCLKKGYFGGTQLSLQKFEVDKKYKIIFTLNGRRQGIGKGNNWQEAFESALKGIRPNELDNERFVGWERRVGEVRKVKIPKDINRYLAQEWLGRMLLDKGFPKGADVDIEINSYPDFKENKLIFEVWLTVNGKRYEKGGDLSGSLAFHDALEQVGPNDLSPEGFQKYQEMLKKLKKFRMPKELQKPIYKKWLARALVDVGQEFDPEMTVNIEKKTDEETEKYYVTIDIPGTTHIGRNGKTPHDAFAGAAEGIREYDEATKAHREDDQAKPNIKPLNVYTEGAHESIAKSRQAGEADLLKLANKQGFSDFWLYTRHYNGQEFFHECGENETQEKTDFDIMALEKVAPKNKIGQATLYKQHPIDRTSTLDKSQMLSEQDLMSFLFVLEMMKDRNPQLAERMDFRVAVSSGIYRVKFHPEILNHKNLMTLVIHRIRQLHEAWLRPQDEGFDYEQRRRSDFAKTNTAFAKKFSSRLMEITFEPAAK